MDTAFSLECKTQGNGTPQGRPRVYFCCHPDDFDLYFEKLTDELLEIQPQIAFWFYRPGSAPDGDALLADLSQMQLFAVPVTSRFLHEDCRARVKELAFAMEHHIPVLFLMQEQGLEESFNRICGDLQFLDRLESENDPTAIPYEKRLASFLGDVIVGDELAKRVRAAFDAYIFLSYRKKDRMLAQQVMKLIHANELCRDVAIWYDEFLKPGEDFNDAILEAMEKCEVFTLVVTPNILEIPNYVLTTEYPKAVEMGKKILPVEIEKTNGRELARSYKGIKRHVIKGSEKAVASGLGKLLRGVALRTNAGDPVHDYLVGLAYHAGIDMEVDHARALKLIESAAENGVIEACDKLVTMYMLGDGVGADQRKAIEWRVRGVDLLYEKTVADPSHENLRTLWELLDDLLLGRLILDNSGIDPKYKDWFDWTNEKIAENLVPLMPEEELDRFIEYHQVQREGEKLEKEGDREGAFKKYMQAIGICRQQAADLGTRKGWDNYFKLLAILLEPEDAPFPPAERRALLEEMQTLSNNLFKRYGLPRFKEYIRGAEIMLERMDG